VNKPIVLIYAGIFLAGFWFVSTGMVDAML
jgi:hypothetical protein